MKNLLMTFLLLLFSNPIFAQPWTKGLDRNANFYEIQESFNNYWEGKTPGKGQGWKPFKRWEYFWQNRIEPNGDFPNQTALWNAWQQKKAIFGNGKNQNQINYSNWTEIGPNEVVVKTSGYGQGSGRIDCIAVDPTDDNIIWVGSPTGGLWKTSDGGINWVPMTDDLPTLGISWILIDPNNTDIIYIATGDRDNSEIFGIGILKSTDGGQTWNTTGLSYNVSDYKKIYEMIFDPNDSNTILAATQVGILKSTDGAATWTTKQTGVFRDIVVDPNNTNIWYAARHTIGIFKSTDNGETWSSIFTGPSGSKNRVAVDVSPATNPSTIYSLFTSGWNTTVYKSIDNGTTWAMTSDQIINASQASYDLIFGVSPTDANRIQVGTVQNVISADGGVTWTLNNQIGTTFFAMHVDHHAVLWHSGNILFIGNDGGIYKSTDAGLTFQNISGNLGIRQIYRLGVSQLEPDFVLIGAQDNGTAKIDSGVWTKLQDADGMECAVDPTNPDIIYFSIQNGIFYKSVNSGQTVLDANGNLIENGAWVTPFAINQNNPNELYRATNRVLKSTDSAVSWFPISGNLGAGNLTSITLAKSNEDVIYVAKSSSIFRTTDGGANWFEISGNLPSKSITYIAVHPTDENTVWVTHSGYSSSSGQKVYRTNDGGLNWTNVSGSLPDVPFNCVAVDPVFPNHIYAGSDLGIFFSATGGGNWQDFSNGLPNAIVSEIEIHYPSGRIKAATYGRGLWESNLESFSNPASYLSTYNISLNLLPNAFVNKSILVSNGAIVSGLNYSNTILNSPNWVSISPQNGTLIGFSQELMTLSVNATNLSNGVYNATLEFASNDPLNPNFSIPINLTVDSNGGNSPNQPNNFSLIAPTANEIYAFWSDQSNDELGFVIERSANSTSGFNVIDTVLANSTNFVDSNPVKTTEYFYRVTAYNSTGNSEYTNVLSATTLESVPQAPTNLISNMDKSFQVNLFWDDNSDNETNFVVERKIDNFWTNFTPIDTVFSDEISFKDLGLVSGVNYLYRVKAINSAGNSEYSNLISATVLDHSVTLPFFEGFETQPIGKYWNFESSEQFGQVQVSNSIGIPVHSGNFHLIMDASQSNNLNTNSATLEINPENKSNLNLLFWWKDFQDENNIEDGIFISDDGENFVLAFQLIPENYANDWNQFSVNLSQVASSNGLTVSHPFYVRFQQRDNFPISGGDGFAFDDISIISSELITPQVTLELIGNNVQLNWNSILGANFYKIYKSVGNPNFIPNTSNLAGITPTLNFTDSNVFNGNKIFYIVTANTDSLTAPISSSKKLEVQK